jgi:hypothetical protein
MDSDVARTIRPSTVTEKFAKEIKRILKIGQIPICLNLG